LDWQLIIVALCVLFAAAVMLRRVIRWLRPSPRGSSACGGCSTCASAAAPPVIVLETIKPSAKP